MMNDTLSPLVSIIICVYNGEKYLERCLQSAMSQSYKNIEIIVVNDGSMDNTPVIIENYVKLDCRIIVISKQNGGISEARRKLEYLQPIITQYFIDNKSEIWLLFLIAHSKR